MTDQESNMLQLQIVSLGDRLTAMGARMDRYEGDMRSTMNSITEKLDSIKETIALRNGEKNGVFALAKWFVMLAGPAAAWFGALHFGK